MSAHPATDLLPLPKRGPFFCVTWPRLDRERRPGERVFVRLLPSWLGVEVTDLPSFTAATAHMPLPESYLVREETV